MGLTMHFKNAGYLIRHKWFVLLAGWKVGAPLWRLVIHDWSKFLPDEWFAYARSFYGPRERSSETKAAFKVAWLKHIHRNSHHHQHWVLREDSGREIALKMPQGIAREMVADWAGAGRAITGRWELAEWYGKNKYHMRLHPDTAVFVDSLIDKHFRPKEGTWC